MPTEAEFQELINKTTNEWTQVNGVNGYKFTGSNGNSIFIPAAGAYINGLVKNVGSSGSVLGSSLRISDPDLAYSLYFNSDSCYMDDGRRCDGFAVRGVCE